jgi:preprotein translocase subunit SecA
MRPPEGEAISAGILNRSIETAQKRVEQRNYTIRKHTLEYDDVMNKQRKELYAFRNEVLHTNDVEGLSSEILTDVCSSAAEKYFVSRGTDEGWDPEGYRQWLMSHFPITFEEGYFDQDLIDVPEIENMASEVILKAFKEKLARDNSKIPLEYRLNNPVPPTSEAIRRLIIRKIDQHWQEHLLRMDHLRADVALRSVGQRDPLTEFKHEAFKLFDEFSQTVRTEIAHDFFRFELMVAPPPPTIQQLLSSIQLETNRSLFNDMEEKSAPPPPSPSQNGHKQEAPKQTPIIMEAKAGRNDPCPCGSGKKYKKCCAPDDEKEA